MATVITTGTKKHKAPGLAAGRCLARGTLRCARQGAAPWSSILAGDAPKLAADLKWRDVKTRLKRRVISKAETKPKSLCCV